MPENVAMEKTLRGKALWTFPPRLEIPQRRRDSHFPHSPYCCCYQNMTTTDRVTFLFEATRPGVLIVARHNNSVAPMSVTPSVGPTLKSRLALYRVSASTNGVRKPLSLCLTESSVAYADECNENESDKCCRLYHASPP